MDAPTSSEPRLDTDLDVTSHFAAEYLTYNRFLPLRRCEGRVQVAIAGALDEDVGDDLSRFYRSELDVVRVGEDHLLEAIRRAYAEAQSVHGLIAELGSSGAEGRPETRLEADARDLANQPPVIRFVNLLIKEAHAARASDIHIESGEQGLSVRLRIDGALVSAPSPPAQIERAVVSRIKLLAELDIAEKRIPQDGRIVVRLENVDFDVRVSTVPTLYGESVVIRLLAQGTERPALDELGMDRDIRTQFARLATKPHGIVLVTGPTGSGKTTTLYAGLGLRDALTEKIITVEDPIEYNLPGVTQVPVNRKAGVTFASALRSLLRQDPDIVMIGEIRDPETAAIGIQAAMTGHLVFSTLHTNDSARAISRLVDLGVEPYMIASALEGVVAQRLVRTNCPECRERYTPDEETVARIAPTTLQGMKFERGAGCAACTDTGFRGRTGVFEILMMSDALRASISRGEQPLSGSDAPGSPSPMLMDGWRKVRAGLTTVEEVLRVAHS